MKMDLITVGMLVIFIGIIIVFIGALAGAGKGESKFAVGGIIGFIPFGFGNDKRMVWFVIVLSFFILIAFWIFRSIKT